MIELKFNAMTVLQVIYKTSYLLIPFQRGNHRNA